MTRFPLFFLSHGGPTFMYKDTPRGGDLGSYDIVTKIGNFIRTGISPKFVLCVSAHWQAEPLSSSPNVQVAVPDTTLSGNKDAENDLIYDFFGFPDYMYLEQFHSKPSLELANKVVSTLQDHGLQASTAVRGIDHGVWVPFKVAFSYTKPDPEALLDIDIPLIQVSLPSTDDFETSYKLGQALAAFREDGVVIVSGQTVHNLNEFRTGIPSPPGYHQGFADNVTKILVNHEKKDRLAELKTLKSAENFKLFRSAHPTDEHFLPLVVGAGAADNDPITLLYSNVNGPLGWGFYQTGESPSIPL